ncbi:MAG: DUF1992 domain-containing protein [Gammaproteobacteria bacterium]
MNIVHKLAESRIRQAMEAGELDNLPGAGRPLKLDDDRHVPPELRAAYRLLKNSGYLPPEAELRRDIADARALLSAARCEAERSRAARRLELLRMRLAHGRGGAEIHLDPQYEQQLLDGLSRED